MGQSKPHPSEARKGVRAGAGSGVKLRDLQSSFRQGMAISALIIDDEQLARDELKYLLD